MHCTCLLWSLLPTALHEPPLPIFLGHGDEIVNLLAVLVNDVTWLRTVTIQILKCNSLWKQAMRDGWEAAPLPFFADVRRAALATGTF